MSDDEPETAQLNIEVPRRTKDLAKQELEHGGLTRVVRERLHKVAHGEHATEIERVKDELRELRDERQDLQNKRSRLDDDLDDVEIRIERAEQRLSELRDAQGEYEGALQLIEEMMHNEGARMFVGHGNVVEAARIGDCTQEDVLEDLKERNPELPESRFTEGSDRTPQG